jgi:membrane protease YdiL (CAAX protease family)
MQALTSLWRRLPVIVQAILSGIGMAALGVIPWSLLASLNLRYGRDVPWAIIPTAIYLKFYWRFASGTLGPRAATGKLYKLGRTGLPRKDAWGEALMAGVLGLFAILLFQGLSARLMHMPQQSTAEFDGIPSLTIIGLVIASAVVAGTVEEISYRGFMQGPIERRHGPFVAIGITGIVFGLSHYTHKEMTLALMPFYMLVAINYGVIAWLTDSVRPGILLHAGGNIVNALLLLSAGRSEWRVTREEKPLVWETGGDVSFWGLLIGFIATTMVSVLAFRVLASVSRGGHSTSLRPPGN